jgi:hypothetical protein
LSNGSEFINYRPYRYCQRYGIELTRSHPCKKNDNAHFGQKNWSVVRRLVGYDRYNSYAAIECFNHLYDLMRLYINFFQPVLKLRLKTRHGARYIRSMMKHTLYIIDWWYLECWLGLSKRV